MYTKARIGKSSDSQLTDRGSVLIYILHSGNGVPNITQTVEYNFSVSPSDDYFRQQAMNFNKMLNNNLAFKGKLDLLVGQDIDIATPISVSGQVDLLPN